MLDSKLMAKKMQQTTFLNTRAIGQLPPYALVETSRQAAKTVKKGGRSNALRAKVLQMLIKRPMTADEIAVEIGEDFANIRPRVTELKDSGLIEKTGERRASRMGNPMHVWRAI